MIIQKCCDDTTRCPQCDTCEHDRICCCGNPVEGHGYQDGHGPVSTHFYYCERVDDGH